MIVHGYKKIQEIAEKFSLPEWWIESVIVEFFPCRRFAEDDKLWVFDFDMLSDEHINQITDKKVVVPNYYLVQNIRPKDLAAKTTISLIGLPFITIEDADFTPEGLVNSTGFPFFSNPIEVWDHKLGFNYKAIVLDNGIFYQWTVSEKKDLPGQPRHWYKSDLFSLDELFTINEELQEYRNSPDIKQPDSEFISKIEDAYNRLDIIREPLRTKILEYHNARKTEFDPTTVNVPNLPMLSYFDAIRLTEDGYQVKTHMEPLFLRSAIRNLKRAEEAQKKREENPDDYYALLDEIEYSAMSIISATNCLESYINFIISKYRPKESKIFDDTTSHRQKWLWFPTAMNLSEKFDPEEPPFSDFSLIVRWRNNAIHHKAKYERTRGSVSHTYNQLNVDNAKLAIQTVRDMVRFISKDDKVSLPRWIKTDMGSAEYWDEVRTYLKSIEENSSQ